MAAPLRHNRDFVLLWSGQVVSSTGLGGVTTTLVLAAAMLAIAVAASASPAVRQAPRLTVWQASATPNRLPASVCPRPLARE